MIDFTPDLDLTQPGPVVVRGMPAKVYHALPRLNAGKVAAFAHSTLHGAAEVAKVYDESMDKIFGTVIHTKILEPAEFAARMVEREDIGPGALVTYIKAQREEPEAIILAKGWVDKINGIREGIRQLPRVNRLLFDHHPAEKELSILWTETCRDMVIPCKARIDFFDPERGTVIDYKTTNDCEIGKFERKIGELAYHIKGCWYRRAVQVAGLAEFPRLAWIVSQTAPPYTCAAFGACDEMVEQGWARACVGVHRWVAWSRGEADPLPPPDFREVRLPPWMQEDPETLTQFMQDFETPNPEVSSE